MRNETRIEATSFKYISLKYLDMSPVDYRANDFLKRVVIKQHAKTEDGFQKIMIKQFIDKFRKKERKEKKNHSLYLKIFFVLEIKTISKFNKGAIRLNILEIKLKRQNYNRKLSKN